MSLEERVAALESGELARLRVVAQRRLEKLRIERAAVADLRGRLEDTDSETDRLRQRLFDAIDERAEELKPLRAKFPCAPEGKLVATAIERLKSLSELALDQSNELVKEIGKSQALHAQLAEVRVGRDEAREELAGTRAELMDTRSRLKDALEELAEARAELAKAKAPPADDRLGWFNR